MTAYDQKLLDELLTGHHGAGLLDIGRALKAALSEVEELRANLDTSHSSLTRATEVQEQLHIENGELKRSLDFSLVRRQRLIEAVRKVVEEDNH